MTVAIEPLHQIVSNPEQGGSYPFGFDWWGGANLAVTLFSSAGSLPERALTVGADWVAAPLTRATGGTLTLLADPGLYDRMIIRRQTVVAQEFVAAPTAKGFEAGLDRVVMQQQERLGEFDQTLRLPAGLSSLLLPPWSPGSLIGWRTDSAELQNMTLTGGGATSSPVITSFTADGTVGPFALASPALAAPGMVQVRAAGLAVPAADYSVAGDQLAFASARQPPPGTAVEVIAFGALPVDADLGSIALIPTGGAPERAKRPTTIADLFGRYFEIRDYADYAPGDPAAASDNAAVMQAHVNWVLSSAQRRDMILPPEMIFSDQPLQILTGAEPPSHGFRMVGTGPLGRPQQNNGDHTAYEGGTALVFTGSASSGAYDGVIQLGNSATPREAHHVELENFALFCGGQRPGVTAWGAWQSIFHRLYVHRPTVGFNLRGCYSSRLAQTEIHGATTGCVDLIENVHSFTLDDCAFNGERTLGTETPSFGLKIASVGNCSSVDWRGGNIDLDRTQGPVVEIVNACRGFSWHGGYIELRSTHNIAHPAMVFRAGDGITVLPGRITASASARPDFLIEVFGPCHGVSIVGGEMEGSAVAAVRVGTGAQAVHIPLSMSVSTFPPKQVMWSGEIRTIASGAVVADAAPVWTLRGEGSSADDLVTITGGLDGQTVIIRRDPDVIYSITLKDATGNMQLEGDCVLAGGRGTITLRYFADEAFWREIARGNN